MPPPRGHTRCGIRLLPYRDVLSSAFVTSSAADELFALLSPRRIASLWRPHLPSGEPLLGVEAVALEDKVAKVVEGAHVAGREERSCEDLLKAWRLDQEENFGGRTPAELTLLVGVMLLNVVVVHPPIMFLEEPGPVPG
jgi:hypothetical protein